MERTIAFLQQNKQSFEDYGYFDDHDIYYQVIEHKITPDNCIEACKSLIEGVSKTILSQIDVRNPITKERFLEKDLSGLETTLKKMKGKGEDFQPLFKQAVVALSAYHPSCEREALLAVGSSFCKYLGQIRNDRGDISHGRVAPKLEKSSNELAKIIVTTTDFIVFSMLELLVQIEFEQKLEESDFNLLVNESFLIKDELGLESITSHEALLRAFNNDLDTGTPLPGKARYSQALFQQYPKDYKVQFDEYCENLQKAEEDESVS